MRTVVSAPDPVPEDGDQALRDLLGRLDVSVDFAVGMFAALHTGPDLVQPETWLRTIVSEGTFTDPDEAKRGIDVVLALYEGIRRALASAPETVPPAPDEIDSVTEFCRGYLAGVRLQPAWEADSTANVMVTAMRLLADEVDLDKLRDAGAPIDDPDAFFAGQRAELPRYVAALYRHFRSGRCVPPHQVKVGRNDPCPCGSGKKAKKCCMK